MVSGLETLGAACAVIQVIHFSLQVISGCKKAYDGKPTDDNEVEGYAKEMCDAAGLIQTRCRLLNISDKSPKAERDLQAIADRCQVSARELQTELHSVMERQRKNVLSSAISYMFMSLMRRKRIERLEKRLSREKDLMETRILVLIRSQNDATNILDDQRFLSLESDIQTTARQISRGHSRLEELITAEHEVTRNTVIQFGQAVEEFITTQKQREEFLQSLRFLEIKKRYNDLKGPDEVSFGRVFKSHTKMTSREDTDQLNLNEMELNDSGQLPNDVLEAEKEENLRIDQLWSIFTQRLASSHRLFCILGNQALARAHYSSILSTAKPQKRFCAARAQKQPFSHISFGKSVILLKTASKACCAP
ncbi:hypothetical protein IL306_014608 [Fusarium sp. DS 682]|nr:hypothetical protein IL306_014608 [Fusarium sp. DS 682]